MSKGLEPMLRGRSVWQVAVDAKIRLGKTIEIDSDIGVNRERKRLIRLWREERAIEAAIRPFAGILEGFEGVDIPCRED